MGGLLLVVLGVVRIHLAPRNGYVVESERVSRLRLTDVATPAKCRLGAHQAY